MSTLTGNIKQGQLSTTNLKKESQVLQCSIANKNDSLTATVREKRKKLSADMTPHDLTGNIITGRQNLDYNKLYNKPSINAVVLEGDLSLDRLGIQYKLPVFTKADIDAAFEAVFG